MDSDDIIELFAAFGRVRARRMFGGFGIYADGLMFALATGGAIYLKADDETSAAFVREGMGPFTYRAKGRGRTSLSYWRLPDRLYDDPDELAGWARTAHAVARRAKAPKKAAKKARRTLPGKKAAKKKAPTKPKRPGRGAAPRS
jgi:DNA transformation protein